MRPEVEQELAHTLLVELLAYQFASPVRWIETQDVILCDERSRDMRLVEIGPSETLAGMARRTEEFILHESDAAKGVRREILSYSQNAKQIYYDVDPVDDEPEPEAASPTASVTPAAPSSSSSSSSASAPAPPTAAPAPTPSAGPAPQVADAPVTATDIVRAIIAQKLKKPLLEIPLSKAIKDLVGGKSTLQNEILGDLGKEFGSTPEKPEDTPLEELGASMQQTFNGELGKTSQGLIARVVSSKVPNSLGMSGVRKYLETRWGLPQGRQNGLLLLAITLEPAQRFKSENDAKAWLDDMANQYAAHARIDLSSPVAGGDAGGAGAGMMMDPAALDALTADQRMLFKKQLELLANYLKMDLRAGDKAALDVQQANSALQSQIDLWNAEHGEFYATGIEPQFTPLKARVYDSAWNWARQDALSMYYDIIFGRLKAVDREIVSRCIAIMNRANPTLLEFMQYHIDHCPAERGETYQLAKELGQVLIDNCREILDKGLPVYKEVSKPTAPHLEIDAKGNLNYSEIPRANIRKFEQYVTEMAEGGKLSEYNNRTKVQYDLQRIYKLIKGQQKLSKSSKLQVKNLYGSVIRALAMNEGQMLPNENGKPANGIAKKGRNGRVPASQKQGRVETVPFIHLKRKDDSGWDYSKKLTSVYLNTLEKAAHEGLSFQGKNALLTGAGAGSIGAEVLQGLISGGAKVVVTTSRYSPEVTAYYQSIYTRYGAKGSQLIVVPFNQGSKQDVQALVEYIYDTTDGLGWDLDIVIPFAAISENGREIDGLDSKSELAHRIMLTNLLRLLGAVKTQKQAHGYETRPAQVILPLSPNHGTFGNDGLYAESKIALETLFTRWHSESWGNFLTICGAVIGWTRGTGLMAGNNIVAEGIEKYGVRTFSQAEMAFNLLGLMAPEIANLCQVEPVWADLNGGFQYIPNLKDLMTDLRKDYMETSEVRQAVIKENAIENKIVHGEANEALYHKVTVQPRANIKFDFPKLPDWETEVKPLNEDLKGMVDLEKVVVVTGFAEVGPWGNARTRWEMEAHGQFTLEGCVEMAWIMGLIKHFKGNLKTGQQYSGWVDAKTGEPVEDRDIKTKYEKHILEHSGIRLIEPELFNGYDPQKKELLQEIQVDDDLGPIEGSKEMAEDFKRKHGDLAEVFPLPDSDQYTIRLKKGAIIHVPKALRFDRLVAGQIPTGWDARKYGVPEDIISQVDPVTLFTLVCVSEALLTSGITDPYELYQYVHLSQVGNCIGSGIGGTTALRGMYKDRYLDKPLQKDILQESFINTMSAWVNMLLLSSTGPIKTPVGACATAVESVDIGYDTIVEGKARLCLVGGFDDFQEEGSYEFANMKATSNADDEFARGRTPREMSRPTTTTRNGFMEAQGCGVQVLMDARLALDMGVPIYGIVALSGTATDKIGRSVPAPGKGVLTMARESPSAFPSPMLDIKHRRRLLERRLKAIKRDLESEISDLKDEIKAHKSRADLSEPFDESAYWEHRVAQIRQDAKSAEKEALGRYGNNFWKQDPTIAPIRGALATWNLTVDDLGVASFHGTSTVANDKNESDVINSEMAHLGRSKGNALLGIFQKYLTGHPKGAAGAWMMNGCLQVLDSGLVPGNRNADNVDQVLEKFDYLLYPSRTIQTDGVKAFSVTSFGFGQKGAQVIGVHPKYLFATLDQTEFAAYRQKVEARQKKAYTYFHDGLINNSLFRAKDKAPYADDDMQEVFLDPEARATLNPKTSQYTFNSNEPAKGPGKDTSEPGMEPIVKALQASAGDQNFLVGYDEEKLSSLNIENETFLERNYTDAEIAYCQRAGSPLASFTGKWCAKEAVFKSLHVKGKGGGAAMKEIEILNDETGAPVVKLHGDAASAAKAAGVTRVDLTISHGEDRAVAIAVAHRAS